MKVAVAVSGGIDSLYTLIYLHEQGYDVLALHARFINSPYDPVPSLKRACNQLNIPLFVIDLKKEFEKEVITPFFEYYNSAKTPNPCAICNKTMKFGLLINEAKKLGCDKLATGHYVKLSYFTNKLTQDYGYVIQCADDTTKDQSYFLALTPIESLRYAFFPLATKKKEEIKTEIANKNIEIPCPKESQEICFVPNDDYRAFINANHQVYSFDINSTGDILYINSKENIYNKIAEHKGLWQYTEGQRKGLGIAWKEPLYVIKRNAKENVLYVGNKNETTIKYATANSINYLVPPYLWQGQLYAKTRFREKQSPAKIYIQNVQAKLEILINNPSSTEEIIHNYHIINTPETKLVIEFEEEKQLYAPGQVLAVYDENNFLLAGGILY